MKTMSRAALVLALMNLGACALVTNRSYLTEMEHDDEALFRPREDFPVVAGDEGEDWRSDEVIRQRTPASITERINEQEYSALEKQLSRLENAQSEGAYAHYQEHRARLATTSERIYFLQLNNRAEREEYLESRGLLSKSSQGALAFGVQREDLLLEMSKDDVIASWGKPDRVDIAGKASYENERWTYQHDGAVKYVYFEGGRVGGWTSNSTAPSWGQKTLP